MATQVAALNVTDPIALKAALVDLANDLAALRGGQVATNAKLDADATVTDTNYAATCNPAALTFTPKP